MSDKEEAFETFEFDLPPIRGFPELRWAGKRPFRSTQYFPAQKKEAYGDPTDGWWNRIYWGDNLQVMSHLLREFRGKVDLIYIDPPFDSGADYKKKIRLKSKEVSGDTSSFEEKQYNDLWVNDSYIQFMYERLIILRELLSEGGSLFVHVDHRVYAYLKVACDEIFGGQGFQSAICWKSSPGHADSTLLGGKQNIIVYFTKGTPKTWNQLYEPYDEEYLASHYQKRATDGRRFEDDNLTAYGLAGGGYEYEWNGVTKLWRCPKDTMQRMHDAGEIYYTKNGVARYKRFLDEMPGNPLSDLWLDLPRLNSQAKEKVGYPTQKPEALLSRILSIASNPGDLVFDCFMGSGTTQSVAAQLGRRFIGADINLGAIETTIKRLNAVRLDLEKSNSELPIEGDDRAASKFFTGFEVYNVNNYDLFRNPVEARELIKEAMELQPLGSGSVFDGQREEYLVKIMPVNRVATRADLNEVINGLDFKAFEARAAKAPNKPVERIHLVCMGHEPDLGPALVKEAKPFEVEVIVTDLIRDKAHLQFKRASDARLKLENGELVIDGFYPMNLLQKLSMETEAVEDWRQLVDSIKVDWNYDGAVLNPTVADSPEGVELVAGRYEVPPDASTIRVKITDLLSESWEGEIENA